MRLAAAVAVSVALPVAAMDEPLAAVTDAAARVALPAASGGRPAVSDVLQAASAG